MSAARHHHHRQRLRARPVEGAGQRHHLIGLTVDHQGTRRHGSEREVLCRGADQHQLPRMQGRRSLRGHIGAERKTGQRNRLVALPQRMYHRQRIVDLAPPLVPFARRVTDAAEVEARGTPSALREGARKRHHHLVVHRAAELRMRMADQRQAARGTDGLVNGTFEFTSRASHYLALRARIHSENTRSARLLTRLGLVAIETVPAFEIRPGTFRACTRFEFAL